MAVTVNPEYQRALNRNAQLTVSQSFTSLVLSKLCSTIFNNHGGSTVAYKPLLPFPASSILVRLLMWFFSYVTTKSPFTSNPCLLPRTYQSQDSSFPAHRFERPFNLKTGVALPVRLVVLIITAHADQHNLGRCDFLQSFATARISTILPCKATIVYSYSSFPLSNTCSKNNTLDRPAFDSAQTYIEKTQLLDDLQWLQPCLQAAGRP